MLPLKVLIDWYGVTQWNGFDWYFFNNNKPNNIPIKFAPNVSNNKWSHQHSLKFGNICPNDDSITSKPTDIIIKRTISLKINDLANHPKKCANINIS